MNYIKRITERVKGNRYIEEDIISAIKNNNKIYTSIIMEYPEHNEDNPLEPLSIYEDDVIVKLANGDIKTTKLKFISRISDNVK